MGVFDVKPSESKQYELAPAGSHVARCVAVIDLGTHTESFPGKPPSKSRKVFIVWELCDEETSDGKPHYLGKRFTLSIHEKANLGKLIGYWRGKSLAPDEGFQLGKLLGQECMLNVTHETSKQSGKQYAAVSGDTKLPKGMKAAAPKVTPLEWTFESGKDYPVEDWIPYVHGTALRQVLGEAEEAKGRQPAGVASEAGDADDSIAF